MASPIKTKEDLSKLAAEILEEVLHPKNKNVTKKSPDKRAQLNTGSQMSSPPKMKEDLKKLSSEMLDELYNRQSNILKSRIIVNKLPDKGAQLKQNLKKVEDEIGLRKNMKQLEDNMKVLSLNTANGDTLKDKHSEHMCAFEKTPAKERYKPFSTLNKSLSKENPTQLIKLKESVSLLEKQAHRVKVEQLKTNFKPYEEESGEESEND